jgi:hypothetical protein
VALSPSAREAVEAAQSNPLQLELAWAAWKALGDDPRGDIRSGYLVVELFGPAAVHDSAGAEALAQAAYELFELSGEPPRPIGYATLLWAIRAAGAATRSSRIEWFLEFIDGVRTAHGEDDGTCAEVEASLSFAAGTAVSFADTLEVSLDCPECRRTARTVVFDGATGTARCTPTGHAFPGILESVGQRERSTALYRIQYVTDDFVDPKRHEPSVRHPTWARIFFALTCPCGRRSAHSTHNNLDRPCAVRCDCGLALYTETAEMPVWRAYNRFRDLLYEHERSSYRLYLEAPDQVSAPTRELLAAVTGRPWAELAERAVAGVPVYEQAAYQIEEPLQFSKDLTRMVLALLQEGANFQMLHNGRDMKRAYARSARSDKSST